ncbi:hypothetical protein D3C77_438030 [compost metagenome]
MAPGVVEALEVVDVDQRQSDGSAASLGLVAHALQLFVERLAIGQVGQGVGHGVAADLLQVIAQLDDLAIGGLEPTFQRRGMTADPARGVAERGDDDAQAVRIGRRSHAVGCRGQGVAVVGLAFPRLVDGRRHRRQFAVQHGAGVANLFGQAASGQEFGGQHLGRGIGERRAAGQQARHLLAQRTVRRAEIMQPKLEIQRGRPDGGRLHGVHRPMRQSEGFRTADRGFDLSGHALKSPWEVQAMTLA